MRNRMQDIIFVGLLAGLLAACGGGGAASTGETTAGTEPTTQPTAGGQAGATAVATMQPTEGNQVSGTVHFEQTAEGLAVQVDLTGLPPNSEHGFHVHENGDCSAPDASSAGDHYNPEGHPHALPDGQPRHAGDMGNITADDNGEVHTQIVVDTMSIDGQAPPVVGRAVIVHASPDTGAQPTGEAGARIACGVVEAS